MLRSSNIEIRRILYILFIVARTISGIQLDDDGGYHISIGIGESSPIPTDVQIYVTNLENKIEELSTLIYDATDGLMFVKSADILLPSHWDFDGSSLASSQSFSQSNIKISSDFVIPDVTNPTPCGQPGNEIRLPFTFFEDTTDEVYKRKEKSLLHLWAQYRWGVYEESGFPGNSRFPYSKLNDDETGWNLSTCTNAPVTGSFEYSDEAACIVTDVEFPLDPDCRFVPDEDQDPGLETSLMTNFYWLDGITSFCDETTHDYTLNNRQNTFCDHKSILEVFRTTPDYAKVTLPGEFVAPTFSVLEASDKPLIYMLIDRRILQTTEEDAMIIRREFSNMLSPTRGIDFESIVSLARFPAEDGEGIYDEIVSWGQLGDTVEDFQTVFDEITAAGSDDNSIGNYGASLKSISESVRARQHKNGAYVFVFKSSTGNNMGLSAYEQDVFSSLIAQNIKLYAVEINNSGLDPGESLLQLATIGYSGTLSPHLILASSDDISRKLPTFLDYFIAETKNPTDSDQSYRTIFKSQVTNNPTEIKVFSRDLKSIRIFLTSLLKVIDGKDAVTFHVGSQSIPVTEESEWKESFAEERKKTFTGIVNTPTKGEIITVSFQCGLHVPEEECSAFLVIFEETSGESIGADGNFEVTVSTSAVDKTLSGDFAPLLFIFAHIEQNGEPLIDLNSDDGDFEAFAELCLKNSPNECLRTPMSDNGAGTPDLLRNDGIISGAIMLSQSLNGVYNCRVYISVEVSVNEKRPITRKQRQIGNIWPCSLAPETENCVGHRVTESFKLSADLPHEIEIIGTNPTPPIEQSRIADLRADNDGLSVTLSWISPSVFTSSGIEQVDTYVLKYCLEYQEMLDDFDLCTSIEVEEPKEPGQMQQAEFEAEDVSTYHFAVKSTYDGQPSLMSNIVSHRPLNEPTKPTGETETPTTPSTTNSDIPTETTDTYSTTGGSTGTESTPGGSTGTESTTEGSTDTESTTGGSTGTESTTGESTDTESTTAESTTGGSTTDAESTTGSGSTDLPTDTTVESTTTTATTTTTTRRTTPTTATTETPEYFFKRPEGYITIGAVGLVVVVGLGGAVGYLFYKRRGLMMAAANKSPSKNV